MNFYLSKARKLMFIDLLETILNDFNIISKYNYLVLSFMKILIFYFVLELSY